MSIWTDSVEKTLNTIKLNSKKLSENYMMDYETFKTRLMYINAPLVILSALNAYAVYGFDSFSGNASTIVHVGSISTSVLIAGILGGEMCFGVQRYIQNAFNKHKDFDALQKRIDEVLSLNRGERKIDPNAFFSSVVQDYKDLITDEPYITKYGGQLQSALSDSIEDIQGFVEDHWNILFRPYFRRIKQKNEKVIEALKTTGQEVQQTLETITEKVVIEPVNAATDAAQPVIEQTGTVLGKVGAWIPFMSSASNTVSETKDTVENAVNEVKEMAMERLYPSNQGGKVPLKSENSRRGNGLSMNFVDKR